MQIEWILAAALASLAVAVLLLTPGADGAVAQSNFRNIQVLTDMTDRDIQLTMQSWTRQFGSTCFDCHVQGDFASDAIERKQTARRMAEMVRALNDTTYFRESSRAADCFLCHQGSFVIPEFE